MKKPLNSGIFLAVISAIAALLLSLVNNFTAPIIKEAAAAAEAENLSLIFNNGESFGLEDVSLPKNSPILGVYSAASGGSVVGYAYKVSVQGYSDVIEFIVGINNTDAFQGIAILSLNDTKGIGTRIEEDEFTAQFTTKNIADSVDTLSGATVSSGAVKNGVDAAVAHYRATFK